MGRDGEKNIQINSLESVQTQTKHAESLLMDFQLSRIRKWNGLGRMHQSLKRHGKSILSLFPEDLWSLVFEYAAPTFTWLDIEE